jgi:hypothetical protein
MAIVAVELLLIFSYTQAMNARLLPFHVYPFVWLNLSAWALWRASTPPAPRRRRWIARVAAGGYFLVLAYIGGIVRPGHAFQDHGAVPAEQLTSGLRVLVELPPGFSPAVTYSGMYVIMSLVPYMVVGFLALTYLLYVTLLSASGDASIGLVGLFSCVGCSFPLLATLLSGGAASAAAAFVYSQAYTLSTVVFAVTLLVLYWRPLSSETCACEASYRE